MASIIHTFCVVACISSGLYGCIIYYYFRDAKRMIWFAALSFSLGLSIVMTGAFEPLLFRNRVYLEGFSDNLYLSALSLSIMCMNIYVCFGETSRFPKISLAINYICFVLAVASLLIPVSMFDYLFTILFSLCLYVYILAMVYSIRKYSKGHTYYIFQIISFALMTLSSILSLVMALFGFNYYSPRVFAIPVFLFLHAVMMTRKYRLSRDKTSKLSTSLSETIERINHSDNALMCTQMKADFLYRSLDLISQKCDEDPFMAEDLTVSLSKYLRHTLNFQQLQGIVPLTNEIELTKAFIAIERQRNTKIKYEYKFPDPLPDFHIPPLSIQPLVENAIHHGFSDDQDNPKITITIIPYRDYFHVDVSDNGTGMDEETVAALTESLHDSARIGIFNIHTRLINLFGKGLVIQSAPGVGTSVSFVVPPDAMSYVKDKEEDKS